MSSIPRVFALCATVAIGVLAARAADAAPTGRTDSKPAAAPAGEIVATDDAEEFFRVATGFYDETPRRPARAAPAVPAARSGPETDPSHDPLEIMAIAVGAYDEPRPASSRPAPSKTVDEPAAPKPRGVDLANPYKELVERYARLHGLPPELADAVMRIESSYDPKAYNAGAIGLMQILLPTARGLGYAGDAEGLTHPETNLKYGIMYLAQAYRLSQGDTCETVMRYQSGHYASRPNAANVAYCRKAKTILARAG